MLLRPKDELKMNSCGYEAAVVWLKKTRQHSPRPTEEENT